MRILAVFALLALLAGAAPAQDFGVHPNEIGVYTTPTPASAADTDIHAGAGFGQFVTYLVLSNATDEASGEPIVNLGGFELSMSWPAGWGVIVALPAGCFSFDPFEGDFFESCAIPVPGNYTVLAELTFQSFGGGQMGGVYLAPYGGGPQTIPGHMAVTDADRGFAPSRAYPISGSYDLPVAGIDMPVVPEQETTWSALKSMYRQ